MARVSPYTWHGTAPGSSLEPPPVTARNHPNSDPKPPSRAKQSPRHCGQGASFSIIPHAKPPRTKNLTAEYAGLRQAHLCAAQAQGYRLVSLSNHRARWILRPSGSVARFRVMPSSTIPHAKPLRIQEFNRECAGKPATRMLRE
jgi:hypothetical protein